MGSPNIPSQSNLTIILNMNMAESEVKASRAHGKPLVAIAGLGIETSTFSPARTRLPEQFRPSRGDSIMDDKYIRFLGPDTELRHAANWRGALIGQAVPGGIVTRELFDSLAAEICTRLLKIVLDAKADNVALEGLWFDIHGAMCVEGLSDAEHVLLRRIRRVIGPDVLISASMDLHGNVSKDLAHECDLLTCYRTAPHIDTWETKERACRNLLELIEGKHRQGHNFKRPLKAWIPIPILLPGEQTSTRDEPAKSLYERVPVVEDMHGVIDASVWVGYAWADEPRDLAVVVVTGWDRKAVKKGAEDLANCFWDVHEDFHFVAKTGNYKECIDAALNSSNNERPFFVSDSGDNPTAGGSGDVTWGLTRLLERPEFQHKTGPIVIYASIPGPEAVHIAEKAGVGATVTVTAGAEVDDLHSGPLTMTGRVHAIKHGDQYARLEVVLQIGTVYAILTETRKPYHLEKDYTDLDLKPREAGIVIVKIGYLEPELYDMAKGWLLALTPGGVDQDIKRLGHRHVQRPIWPLDKHFEQRPDLTARFIPASNQPFV
ncbi:hypothetical protein LTR05_003564 [Lithohypha guttulata]|uniref:Microcystin LR degradation protein MlrC n=1 Tax=Lithohypha guttulata TaxID=1690604 RepID=A0AAN7T057_9EURO|nr:hypothetical protein LTR05_003564 [Lithohypha guttulata]